MDYPSNEWNWNVDVHSGMAGRHLLNSTAGSTEGDPEGFELNGETGGAIVIVIVLSALANSVGVAGGFFWVPLFNALLGFGLTGSAALSQALIACGTTGATAYSMLHGHPWDHSRPLIDYSLAVVLMPAMILGITVGSMLNLILPTLILVCILFVILVAVSIRTFQQAMRERAAEKALRLELADLAPIEIQPTNIEEARPREPDDNWNSDSSFDIKNYGKPNSDGTESPSNNDGTQSAPVVHCDGHTSVWKLFPWRNIGEIFAVFIVFLGLQIGKSFYGHCDWEYIFMFCLQAVVVVGASASFIWLKEHPVPVRREDRNALARRSLQTATTNENEIVLNGSPSLQSSNGNGKVSRESMKFCTNDQSKQGKPSYGVISSDEKRVASEVHDQTEAEVAISIRDNNQLSFRNSMPKDDDQNSQDSWNIWHLAIVWIVTIVVGVISGTVGLGGGVLIAPLMVELKVHPQSAAATSTFIVIFASTIAAVAFALDNKLNLVYTAVYGPMSLIGGFLGAFVIIRVVRRWHIASIVLFMLAFLVACAAGLVVGFAGRKAVTDIVNGEPIEVADICDL